MNILAADPAYADVLKKLRAQLMAELKASRDLRMENKGEVYENFPYLGRKGKKKKASKVK